MMGESTAQPDALAKRREEVRRGISRGVYEVGVEHRQRINPDDAEAVTSASVSYIRDTIPLDTLSMLGESNVRAFFEGGLKGIPYESIPVVGAWPDKVDTRRYPSPDIKPNN